jgi:hypothetical protein
MTRRIFVPAGNQTPVVQPLDSYYRDFKQFTSLVQLAYMHKTSTGGTVEHLDKFLNPKLGLPQLKELMILQNYFKIRS